MECGKKKDRSPLSLEPRFAKRVRSQQDVSKGNVEGFANGMKVSVCRHCKKRHPSECWKKSLACFRCGSTEHQIRECPQRR